MNGNYIAAIAAAIAAACGLSSVKGFEIAPKPVPVPEAFLDLIPVPGNASRKKQFGLFLTTPRGRAWLRKHRRIKANA